MRMRDGAWRIASAAAIIALLAAGPVQSQRNWAEIDQVRANQADADLDNWLLHGRTYDESRFSPLDQINDRTVVKLKPAWYADLDTARGQEATPIVVDGVMYTSTAWSKVLAFDAKTGRRLWSFDPQNDGAKGVHACCDFVNRGVAVYQGKVFVGTIDGRLIALDAATGETVWSVVTVDQSLPYTITGAPRVFKNKVVIGNSGAEFGVRGYVTAYDVDTGSKAWRFYTVPGNPAEGPDGEVSDEPLARLARPTWAGEWWKLGGGGTVWDSIVYDQELDQLLIGVGNGSPWNHRLRSDGKGDNLFLSSIVAVNPDTGEYKWHYQETPGETWDFTATQQMILATLDLGQGPRKVVMQAPKNGFFFIIDRTTGEFLSAEPYVPVNWATGYGADGRPIEVAGARYETVPFTITPSGVGAHGWMPMSYSPRTGLVYIPTMEVPLTMRDQAGAPINPGRWNTGVGFASDPKGPALPMKGRLLAWNPSGQREVWRHEYDWPWNGGALSTAGNLVFQGDARGVLHAFEADTGRELWTFQAGRGIMAAPISYRIDGIQYVAVLAGYGGGLGVSRTAEFQRYPVPNGRLLVFRLDGDATIPVERPPRQAPLVQVADQFTDAQRSEGAKWYGTYCSICHEGPVNPNLRRSAFAASEEAWHAVLIDGALASKGMASFRDYLTPAQAESIRAHVASLADEARSGGQPPVD